MSMKSILAVIAIAGLVGCGQQFRYPCQNPENWNAPECQRPICEVNRDCPDIIFKEDVKIRLPATVPAPAAPKGDCK